MPRADAILDEHVQVGPHAKVVVPVAAAIFQANEPHFAPRRAAREPGPVPLAVAYAVLVGGDFRQLQLDLVDRRRIENDRTERVDDEFLLDDFLDLDDLRNLYLFTAAGRHFVDLFATADLAE